ncbi:MAG: tRNA nucleotidyltransferase [Xanthobacteraceae bacterium]|nr:tRNA nucleotidyltransferase [Xanthobacteraceae bacterium]
MTSGATAVRIVPDVWPHDRELSRLMQLLNRDGEEARVVGGAVRNALLGEPIADLDIATTAVPDEVMRRAKADGLKVVPTGLQHGTVMVVIDGVPFEVTTLRQDVETDGRHAKVEFARDWAGDARRRDFTINALSVGPDGTVYDYVGGLQDIDTRSVRFIGDPAQRIAEDYLRILRFFRFHAAYGHGHPDAEGLHACIVARDGLERLSRERVRAEMLKLLTAMHATATLAAMAEAGLLVRVLAGVPLLASFENMAKVEAAVGLKADPVRRLGALGVFIADDATRLWQVLRLTNAEHERLASMGEAWWRLTIHTTEAEARVFLYRLGPEKYVDRVLLAWARSPQGAADADWHHLAVLPTRWPVPLFPLKSGDFVARGVPKGPALGAALRAAEEAWIAAGFPQDSAELAALADRTVKDVEVI